MFRSAAVLTVLVLALVACQGAASPSAEPTDWQTTPPTDPTPTPSDPAHTPLLTPSADPAGEPADLVLRFQTSVLTPAYPTTLVADGRLTIPTDAGYVQQRLSPAGVHAITQRLLESGLFDESIEIPQPLLPDHDPICGEGLGQHAYHAIELWQDGIATEVTWFTYLLRDDCYASSPQVDAANQLLEELSDPAAWLAADAWVDLEPRPYTPVAYRLMTARQPWPTEAAAAPPVEAMDWPLSDTLVTFGEPADGPYQTRCATISSWEADRVDAALEAVGAEFTTPDGFRIMRGTYLENVTNQEMVGLILEPLRPDEGPCGPSSGNRGICWFIGPTNVFGCPIH